MKEARISQLKNNLSNYLQYVRKGGKVRVLDRDEPVADIVPVKSRIEGAPEELEAFLHSQEAKGIIRRGSGKIPPELFKTPAGPPSGVLKALLDERANGR